MSTIKQRYLTTVVTEQSPVTRTLVDDDDFIRGGLAVSAGGQFVFDFLTFVQCG